MKTSKSNQQSRKQVSHDRIVEVTARAIRRSGYDGTGIADIMKEAGLTHGGFYAHFPSREALLAEAADRAGAETVSNVNAMIASAPRGDVLQTLVAAYLSDDHLNNVELGCHLAALGSEMPRQAPEVRHAATARIKETIDLIARQSPHWGTAQAHEEALMIMSTLLGTLILARAVDDPQLSEQFRHTALKQLTSDAH